MDSKSKIGNRESDRQVDATTGNNCITRSYNTQQDLPRDPTGFETFQE